MNIIFKPFIFVIQKLWLFTLTLKTRCEHKSKTKNVLRESPNSCYKYHACCSLGNEIMTVLTQNSVKWGFLNIRSLKRMPTNNGRKWRGAKETDTKKQVQRWASVIVWSHVHENKSHILQCPSVYSTLWQLMVTKILSHWLGTRMKWWRIDSGSRLPVFRSELCHAVALWTWAALNLFLSETNGALHLIAFCRNQLIH